MPIEITLPAVTADMTETTIESWLIPEGKKINVGDGLLEVETDKAVVEIQAEKPGILAKILVSAGSSAKVGQCLGILLENGESDDAIDQFIHEQEQLLAASLHSTTVSSDALDSTGAPAPNSASEAPADNSNGRILSSPLARRIAAKSGINLATLIGSGPRNRIVKKDVIAAIDSGAKPAADLTTNSMQLVANSHPSKAFAEDANYDTITNSGMRKAISKRLTASKQEAPHFYLSIDVELDALLKLRKELNQRGDSESNTFKISVNDMVIKAAARALKAVPESNVSWTEEAIRQYHNVDISVAVATDSGLITPIIRNADQKGLMALSNEMKSLALTAREGKLQPHEYQGGGFTISNLGMYGVKQFSAIINPPQSCILAIGAGEQRPVVRDGILDIATLMTCTLSVDHRSVDGAVGARFLEAFKTYIEDPVSMML